MGDSKDVQRAVVPGSRASLSGILDPSDKGENMAGMLDPGGAIFKELTGSDFANRLARRGPAQKVRSKLGDDPAALAAFQKAEALAKEKALRAQQKEAARLAAAESEIAERKAAMLPGRGGRSLLTATSPTGTRKATLGGA